MKEACRSLFVFSLIAVLFVFSFHLVVADEVVKTDTAASAGTSTTSTTAAGTTTTAATPPVTTTTTTPPAAPAASTTAGASTSTTTTTGTSSSTSSSTTASTSTSSSTSSTSTSSSVSAIPQAFANEKLDRSTSLTPGSFFYFWEGFRSNFRSDDDNAKQKVAEIQAAVEKGDIASAKKAFESYKEYAAKMEKEADPAKKEEIQRSSAAIKNTMNEIASKISDEKDRTELVGGVTAQAELNAKAVEVADKINTLCGELAKLDPAQYATTCKVDKDAPEWRKKQHEQLTDVQKEEVKKFKNTMIQCMETKGKECKCDDISIKDFALRCKVIAPLADACENEGKQEACEKMDDTTRGMEDLLPEYLQDTFADVQEEMNQEQFGKFMPKECKDAGAKTPQDCALVMIETHAPEECKAELKRQKVTNERDARRICEEIMFKQNAPKECIAAGVKDPKECGTFMCKNNFPKECVDAGLSCDDRNAPRKCQELMSSKGSGKGQGFAFGKSCSGISDKDERLKCFDEVATNVQGAGREFSGQFGSENFGSFNDDFVFGGESGGRDGPHQGGGNWPRECTQAGATTKEACEKIMIQNRQGQFKKQRDYEENFARQCMDKGGRWDCGFGNIDPSNPCRCFQDEQRDFGGDKGQGQFGQQGEGQGQMNFPAECRQANALTPDACRKVMDEQGRQQREQGDKMRQENEQRMREQQDQWKQQQEQFKQQPDQFRDQQQPSSGQFNCPPGQQCNTMPPQGQQQPPAGQQSPPMGTQPPAGAQQPSSNQQPSQQTSSPAAPSSPPPTSPSPSESTSPVSTSPPPATGGVITGNVIGGNDFLKYYFGR